jgi:hypothetical protein
MMHRVVVGAALALALSYLAQPASGRTSSFSTRASGRAWPRVRGRRRSASRRTDCRGGDDGRDQGAGGSARTIDAAGRLLIPGFNDAHAHPGAMPPATRLAGPPAVEHDPTLDEVIARIRTAVPNTPEGSGWSERSARPSSTIHARPARPWTAHRSAADARDLDGPRHHLQHGRAARAGRQRDGARSAGGFFGRMPDGRTLNGLAHEYADYALRQR